MTIDPTAIQHLLNWLTIALTPEVGRIIIRHGSVPNTWLVKVIHTKEGDNNHGQ